MGTVMRGWITLETQLTAIVWGVAAAVLLGVARHWRWRRPPTSVPAVPPAVDRGAVTLHGREAEPGFDRRWRAFLRACEPLIGPALAPSARDEARRWWAAADAYERGELDAAALEQVRVRAWEFRDGARYAGDTAAQAGGLLAAMFRLWPGPAGADWGEEVGAFLDACEAAGVGEDLWGPLLKRHLPELSDRGPDAAAGADAPRPAV